MNDDRSTSGRGHTSAITRRRLLGGLGGAAVAAGVGHTVGPANASAVGAGRRPHIVCIMVDDLGWSDLSTPLTNMGHPSDYHETPALDRIAHQGMAFDNAYASQNCAPTRTAFLTGQYAPRPTNNVYQVDNLNRGGDDTMLVGPAQGLPDGADALPATAVTIGETLRAAGYATGYVGKFHVTASAPDITAVHGFDENLGGTPDGHPGNYHATDGTFARQVGPELDAFAAAYTQRYVDDNIKPYANGTSTAAIDALVGTAKHVTDAVADATIDFMDRRKDAPFFVVMSHYAVHTPIGAEQARADLLQKYQDKAPGTGPSNPSYGALLEGLDQTVARVIDYLQTTPDPNHSSQPLADNTLLVFTSDNGGRQPQANNGPLSGHKAELGEGGIRVPLIAWSRNRSLVDGGTVNSTPVHTMDLYPTFAAVAGASLAGRTIDGAGLSELFADATTELDRDRDSIFWHLPGYLIDRDRDQRPQSVVRSGRWKLLYSYESRTWELYDLVTDIGETTNRAASEPAVLGHLGLTLIHWLNDLDAPLATLRSGQRPVTFRLCGTAYANGQVTQHQGDTIVIEPGDQMPITLERPGQCPPAHYEGDAGS